MTATTILAGGQSWKWLLPSAAPANDPTAAVWTAEAYADGTWSTGLAPLGYGETTGLATNVSPVAPSYTAFDAEPGAAYISLSGELGGRAKLLARLGEEARDQVEALLAQALAFEVSRTVIAGLPCVD